MYIYVCLYVYIALDGYFTGFKTTDRNSYTANTPGNITILTSRENIFIENLL